MTTSCQFFRAFYKVNAIEIFAPLPALYNYCSTCLKKRETLHTQWELLEASLQLSSIPKQKDMYRYYSCYCVKFKNKSIRSNHEAFPFPKQHGLRQIPPHYTEENSTSLSNKERFQRLENGNWTVKIAYP